MKQGLARGSIAVLVALIICKISAFIQEMIVAASLGATVIGDAFNMINGIQETIYPMLAVGITQIFLPAYKSLLEEKDEYKSSSFANYAIIFFTGISVIVVLLLIMFAPIVVNIVAPGFSNEQQILTSHLVRISAISYIFICCASVISSILIANGRFFASEIRGAFTHLPVIIAALFFYETYGIDSLALALIVGSIARLLIMIPFLPQQYHFTLKYLPKKIYTKNLIKKLPASLISSGVTQLKTLVDKIMASGLAVGSISCLNYGLRLYMVLQELFANVIATSSYPKIIELIAKNKEIELKVLINRLIIIIWMMTIPICIGGIFFSKQIVQIAYVRGAFNIQMGINTSFIFSAYLFALPFSSLNGILNNVYFGYGDTKNPMLINLLNLVLNVILNIILVNWIGVVGLALGTSLSSIICLIIRIYLLRKIIDFKIRYLSKQALMIVVGSFFAALISKAITNLLDINILNTIIIGVSIACIVYVIYMEFFKISGYFEIRNSIIKLIDIKRKKREKWN